MTMNNITQLIALIYFKKIYLILEYSFTSNSKGKINRAPIKKMIDRDMK